MIGKTTIKKEKKPFEPVFFFGYGSLMAAAGVNGREMLHTYKDSELIPARLHDYERGMNACYATRNFYGLLPKKGSVVNGVIFPIAEKYDYRALLKNEGAVKAFKQHQVYWATRVTDQMEYLTDFTLPKGWRVMTLVCHQDKTGWGHVDPWYVSHCDEYARQWGKEFYQEFLNTGGWNVKKWNDYKSSYRKERKVRNERRNRRP